VAKLTIVGDPASPAALPRLAFEVADLLNQWSQVDVALEVPSGGHVFVAHPDAEQRAAVMAGIDTDRLATLVHPTATVSRSAQLGRNIMIGAQAVVMMDAIVGDGVNASSLSSIEHDNYIGRFTFFGTGAMLCGRVITGDYAFIGGGAIVQPGVTIGERCTVGTGAVVIRDTGPGSTVVGNPARPIG